MMDECIIISDDEDCQVLEEIYNLEPPVIDLTEPTPKKNYSPKKKPSPQRDIPPERDASPKDDASPERGASPIRNASPVTIPAPQPEPVPPVISDYDLMMSQKALGNEKYKNNLFDDAIRTYRRANELAKKLGNKDMSAIIHFNLAMSYYRLHSYEQAADECAQAVKLNNNYMKAHLKRAEIYQRQGKFDEAVICYEHICELDSKNQDYAILLANAKEAAKRTVKRNYYDILKLPANFTREDLRKAYRQLALNHHPDRHSDADIVTRRIQEKHFKDASEAHSFIQVRFGHGR